MENTDKDLSEKKQLYNSLFDNYKKVLGSLKIYKDKFEKKEFEMNELINENHKLKVRAATAWEEFTPRPSFHEVSFKISLSFEIFINYKV